MPILIRVVVKLGAYIMQERRFVERKLVNTPVRLYHPKLGRLDGISRDISDGGIAIKLNSYKMLNTDSTAPPIFLRPVNLDVLFPVSCLRQSKSRLVVKFLE